MTALKRSRCFTDLKDGERDLPRQSSNEPAQPKDPLRRMEEQERQMEKELDDLDEHIRRAREEQKQKVGEPSQES